MSGAESDTGLESGIEKTGSIDFAAEPAVDRSIMSKDQFVQGLTQNGFAELFSLDDSPYRSTTTDIPVYQIMSDLERYEALNAQNSTDRPFAAALLLEQIDGHLSQNLRETGTVRLLRRQVQQELRRDWVLSPRNAHFIWIGRLPEKAKVNIELMLAYQAHLKSQDAGAAPWRFYLGYDERGIMAYRLRQTIFKHAQLSVSSLPLGLVRDRQYQSAVIQLQNAFYEKQQQSRLDDYNQLAIDFMVDRLAEDRDQLVRWQQEALATFTVFKQAMDQRYGTDALILVDLRQVMVSMHLLYPRYLQELWLRNNLPAAVDIVRSLMLNIYGGTYLDVDITLLARSAVFDKRVRLLEAQLLATVNRFGTEEDRRNNQKVFRARFLAARLQAIFNFMSGRPGNPAAMDLLSGRGPFDLIEVNEFAAISYWRADAQAYFEALESAPRRYVDAHPEPAQPDVVRFFEPMRQVLLPPNGLALQERPLLPMMFDISVMHARADAPAFPIYWREVEARYQQLQQADTLWYPLAPEDLDNNPDLKESWVGYYRLDGIDIDSAATGEITGPKPYLAAAMDAPQPQQDVLRIAWQKNTSALSTIKKSLVISPAVLEMDTPEDLTSAWRAEPIALRVNDAEASKYDRQVVLALDPGSETITQARYSDNAHPDSTILYADGDQLLRYHNAPFDAFKPNEWGEHTRVVLVGSIAADQSTLGGRTVAQIVTLLQRMVNSLNPAQQSIARIKLIASDAFSIDAPTSLAEQPFAVRLLRTLNQQSLPTKSVKGYAGPIDIDVMGHVWVRRADGMVERRSPTLRLLAQWENDQVIIKPALSAMSPRWREQAPALSVSAPFSMRHADVLVVPQTVLSEREAVILTHRMRHASLPAMHLNAVYAEAQAEVARLQGFVKQQVTDILGAEAFKPYEQAQVLGASAMAARRLDQLVVDFEPLQARARQYAQKGDGWLLIAETIRVRDTHTEATLFHGQSGEQHTIRIEEAEERARWHAFSQRFQQETHALRELAPALQLNANGQFESNTRILSRLRQLSNHRAVKVGGGLMGLSFAAMTWSMFLRHPEAIKKLPIGLQISLYWNLADSALGTLDDVARLFKSTLLAFGTQGSTFTRGVTVGLRGAGKALGVLNIAASAVSAGFDIYTLATSNDEVQRIQAGVSLGGTVIALPLTFIIGPLAGLAIGLVVAIISTLVDFFKNPPVERTQNILAMLMNYDKLLSQGGYELKNDVMMFDNAPISLIDFESKVVHFDSHQFRPRSDTNWRRGQVWHSLPYLSFTEISQYPIRQSLSQITTTRVLPAITKRYHWDYHLGYNHALGPREYVPGSEEERHFMARFFSWAPGKSFGQISRIDIAKEEILVLKVKMDRAGIYIIPKEAGQHGASYLFEAPVTGGRAFIVNYHKGVKLCLTEPVQADEPSFFHITLSDHALQSWQNIGVRFQEAQRMIVLDYGKQEVATIDITTLRRAKVQVAGHYGAATWTITDQAAQLAEIHGSSKLGKQALLASLREMAARDRLSQRVKVFFGPPLPSEPVAAASQEEKERYTHALKQVQRQTTTTFYNRDTGRCLGWHEQAGKVSRVLGTDTLLAGAKWIEFDPPLAEVSYFYHAGSGTLQRLNNVSGEEMQRWSLVVSHEDSLVIGLALKEGEITIEQHVPYGDKGQAATLRYRLLASGSLVLEAVRGLSAEHLMQFRFLSSLDSVRLRLELSLAEREQRTPWADGQHTVYVADSGHLMRSTVTIVGGQRRQTQLNAVMHVGALLNELLQKPPKSMLPPPPDLAADWLQLSGTSGSSQPQQRYLNARLGSDVTVPAAYVLVAELRTRGEKRGLVFHAATLTQALFATRLETGAMQLSAPVSDVVAVCVPDTVHDWVILVRGSGRTQGWYPFTSVFTSLPVHTRPDESSALLTSAEQTALLARQPLLFQPVDSEVISIEIQQNAVILSQAWTLQSAGLMLQLTWYSVEGGWRLTAISGLNVNVWRRLQQVLPRMANYILWTLPQAQQILDQRLDGLIDAPIEGEQTKWVHFPDRLQTIEYKEIYRNNQWTRRVISVTRRMQDAAYSIGSQPIHLLHALAYSLDVTMTASLLSTLPWVCIEVVEETAVSKVYYVASDTGRYVSATPDDVLAAWGEGWLALWSKREQTVRRFTLPGSGEALSDAQLLFDGQRIQPSFQAASPFVFAAQDGRALLALDSFGKGQPWDRVETVRKKEVDTEQV